MSHHFHEVFTLSFFLTQNVNVVNFVISIKIKFEKYCFRSESGTVLSFSFDEIDFTSRIDIMGRRARTNWEIASWIRFFPVRLDRIASKTLVLPPFCPSNNSTFSAIRDVALIKWSWGMILIQFLRSYENFMFKERLSALRKGYTKIRRIKMLTQYKSESRNLCVT